MGRLPIENAEQLLSKAQDQRTQYLSYLLQNRRSTQLLNQQQQQPSQNRSISSSSQDAHKTSSLPSLPPVPLHTNPTVRPPANSSLPPPHPLKRSPSQESVHAHPAIPLRRSMSSEHTQARPSPLISQPHVQAPPAPLNPPIYRQGHTHFSPHHRPQPVLPLPPHTSPYYPHTKEPDPPPLKLQRIASQEQPSLFSSITTQAPSRHPSRPRSPAPQTMQHTHPPLSLPPYTSPLVSHPQLLIDPQTQSLSPSLLPLPRSASFQASDPPSSMTTTGNRKISPLLHTSATPSLQPTPLSHAPSQSSMPTFYTTNPTAGPPHSFPPTFPSYSTVRKGDSGKYSSTPPPQQQQHNDLLPRLAHTSAMLPGYHPHLPTAYLSPHLSSNPTALSSAPLLNPGLSPYLLSSPNFPVPSAVPQPQQRCPPNIRS